MRRAAIFDFDGVIINSTDVQRRAFLESYRIIVGNSVPSFEEFLSHSGDSIENIFKKMGLASEMVGLYRKICRENIDHIKVYDGIEALLAHLINKKILCGLCTGKDKTRVVEILNKLKLHRYFDTIVCPDDVINPKPHPESLLLALQRLDVSARHSVMIGDAENDIICAREAGVRSIAVTWGDISRKSLEKASPDFIVEDMSDLGMNIVRLLFNKN